LSSSITVKKDQEVIFEYDPRKIPVFSETIKNSSGKDICVISAEEAPAIH